MTNQAILSAGPSDMPVDMTRVDGMTSHDPEATHHLDARQVSGACRLWHRRWRRVGVLRARHS